MNLALEHIAVTREHDKEVDLVAIAKASGPAFFNSHNLPHRV